MKRLFGFDPDVLATVKQGQDCLDRLLAEQAAKLAGEQQNHIRRVEDDLGTP